MGNLLGIGLRILSSPVGGDDARNGPGDCLAIDIKVVGRSPSIEAIAEVFVKLGEKRVDHRQANPIAARRHCQRHVDLDADAKFHVSRLGAREGCEMKALGKQSRALKNVPVSPVVTQDIDLNSF